MKKFAGKNVVISGGTRGIGKGIAGAFLAEGANVLVTYSSDDSVVKKVEQEYSQYKSQLFFYKFDVSHYAEVQSFFSDLPFDRLDILVNNAGIRRDQIVGMMAVDDWQAVINTNLNGSFYMCKFAVMEMLKHRYGRIINITSPCSHFGFKGQANYAASKAGQIGLTRSLSKEVARKNITVNCVSPGFIETDLISDLPESLVSDYKNKFR